VVHWIVSQPEGKGGAMDPQSKLLEIGALVVCVIAAVGLSLLGEMTGQSWYWIFGIICWVGVVLVSRRIFLMSRSPTPK
jgi:hypothetical protein